MNVTLLVPLAALAAWNVVVWAVWRWDKHRAGVRGARRVPEARLVLLARLLGSAGALVAMYGHADRHKTRKSAIVRDVWFAAAAHLLALALTVVQLR